MGEVAAVIWAAVMGLAVGGELGARRWKAIALRWEEIYKKEAELSKGWSEQCQAWSRRCEEWREVVWTLRVRRLLPRPQDKGRSN